MLYCYEMMSLSELTNSIQKEDPWTPTAADSHTSSSSCDHTHKWQFEGDVTYDSFGSQPFVSSTKSFQGNIVYVNN